MPTPLIHGLDSLLCRVPWCPNGITLLNTMSTCELIHTKSFFQCLFRDSVVATYEPMAPSCFAVLFTMRGKCVSVIVTAVADSALRPLQPTAAYLTARPILLFSECLGPELWTVQLPYHNAQYSRCNRILEPPTQQQKPKVRQHNHCQTAWSWSAAPRMRRHLPRP